MNVFFVSLFICIFIYVGRIPERVVAIGYSDSLLVGKSLNYNNEASYYIIDRTKDHLYAKEEEYLTGPISEKAFNTIWKQRFNIPLRAIIK
jgi:hypothetical protein